jgi:hypothetical protein
MFNGLNPIPARVDRLVGLQELGKLHVFVFERIQFNGMPNKEK